MQSNAPFRYVIVGSGNICRTYLKAIANSPGLAVAGVVSRSEDYTEHRDRLFMVSLRGTF